MRIPDDEKKFRAWVTDLIDTCRVTASARGSEARELRKWRHDGSDDGDPTIYNFLDSHIDRLTSYLYSPSDLRFMLEFTDRMPADMLQKAMVTSRVLSREFERRDIDMTFATAVDQGLTYGSSFVKLLWGHGGITSRLVMPWQFGVYNEAENDLGMQEAVCETTYITTESLWRRVSHMSNAKELYKRAVGHARRQNITEDEAPTFLRATLSGSQPGIQTAQPYTSQPGGMVSGSAAPGMAHVPQLGVDLLRMHELWVVNDKTGDYTTLQVVEPDILITRPDRRRNMFVPEYLPYTMVQANHQPGYFWGRSELAPLLKLQRLVGDRLADIKRIMSLQYDRIFAFTGWSGMNDELYDQFRNAGWIANDAPGAKIEDLTPKLPENAFQEVQTLLKFMEQTSGFSNILSGEGEPGVRAGNHAQTLLKTASPRLRDRALITERQCADVGDKALQLLANKEAKAFWTNPDDGGKSDFLLKQMLEHEYRVIVDSHSSSPIYQEDHAQMAAFLLKSGVIDGESVLDLLPVPMRDTLQNRWKSAQEAKAKMAREHPELLEKKGGRSHHSAHESHGG